MGNIKIGTKLKFHESNEPGMDFSKQLAGRIGIVMEFKPRYPEPQDHIRDNLSTTVKMDDGSHFTLYQEYDKLTYKIVSNLEVSYGKY